MSSDSSFNIHNALYFVKYPSRAAQNSPEGRRWTAGRRLKTPGLRGLRIKYLLRKIFGAKRDEITREWRKLYNTELHALYSSPNIIRNLKSRRLSWAGHVARMEKFRNAYRVLEGKPESKRPLGRPRRRWEDNIKMDLRRWVVILEIG